MTLCEAGPRVGTYFCFAFVTWNLLVQPLW